MAPKAEKDANGDIIVPIKISSHSPGRVGLSGLKLTRDLAPALMNPIKNAQLDEDSANLTLIDLYPYFQDDSDSDTALNFSVSSATNSSIVKLWISGKRYLSADALTGDANDNWTGTVEATVACFDHWGQKTESNLFTIIVKNVNDPPVIISIPITITEPGVPYHYNVTAIDGDKDILQYKLNKAPANMTIDPANGAIEWLPKTKGPHEVNIVVDDGNATAEQRFFINVPNRPPMITSTPPLNASAGLTYIYDVSAEDPNLDALNFSLLASPYGMSIDSNSGTILWTPDTTGNFDISVRVSDGKERACQNYTIVVVQGNRIPEFKSSPITSATVDIPYIYNAMAREADQDTLTFSLETGPANMTIDAAKGKVIWTPASAGNFSVILKVSDGRGGEARQEFVISVKSAVLAAVELAFPPEGKVLRGTVTFSGTVEQGTRDVVNIQISIDGRDWKDALGNYSWTYTLNTKTLSNSQHTFDFRAYDGKEYSDLLTMRFKVDNPAPQKGLMWSETGIMGSLIILIVAAGIAAASSTEVGKYRLTSFFLPLYTRLHKDALLDNETRGMIRGCISTEPGIHYNEIMRHLKLSNGAAAHHLSMLERQGLIKSRSDGYLKRFYPAETRMVDLPQTIKKIEKLILETVQERQGLSQREIAGILEISESTVNRHARQLADMGLLRLERQGMMVKCYLPDVGSKGGF